jgi:hypothetical protein
MAEAKTTYGMFCDMLRHPSAKPLVNRARNFVEQFPLGLSRYDAADKVHNFLTQTEKWMFSDIVVFEAEADDQGRANASEGLEKFVICRLHPKIFGVDPSDEKDDAKLKKHIAGLSWMEPSHLGIPQIEASLWPRVIDELQQINNYKAPCDKLTCIVNACHVINDVLKRTQAEGGSSRPLAADDFLPLLIFAIIRANPPQFHSNAEFAAAFRHPSRLTGEHAYWATMLMSAKEFVRQAGPATLDISTEEFSRNYAASLENAGYHVECSEPSDEPEPEKVMADEGTLESLDLDSSPTEFSNQMDATMPEVSECTAFEKGNVLVYKMPALPVSGCCAAADWKEVIWKGPIRVIAMQSEWAIRMMDESNGDLFAECLIPVENYYEYVTQLTDSDQHFLLKITNGSSCAHVGLGFESQTDASDFKTMLDELKSAHLRMDAATKQPQPSQQQQSNKEEGLDGIGFGSLIQAGPASKSDFDTIILEAMSVHAPKIASQDPVLSANPQDSCCNFAFDNGYVQQPQDRSAINIAALACKADSSVVNCFDKACANGQPQGNAVAQQAFSSQFVADPFNELVMLNLVDSNKAHFPVAA